MTSWLRHWFDLQRAVFTSFVVPLMGLPQSIGVKLIIPTVSEVVICGQYNSPWVTLHQGSTEKDTHIEVKAPRLIMRRSTTVSKNER